MKKAVEGWVEPVKRMLENYRANGGRLDIHGNLPVLQMIQGEGMRINYHSDSGRISVTVKDTSRTMEKLIGVLYGRDRGERLDSAVKLAGTVHGNIDFNRVDAIMAKYGFSKRGMTWTYGETKEAIGSSYGSGVFAGGGNMGPQGQHFTANPKNIRSLPLRPDRLPGQAMGKIIKTISLNNWFTGPGSEMLAMAMALPGGLPGLTTGTMETEVRDSGVEKKPLNMVELENLLRNSNLIHSTTGTQHGKAADVFFGNSEIPELDDPKELQNYLEYHWSMLLKKHGLDREAELDADGTYFFREDHYLEDNKSAIPTEAGSQHDSFNSADHLYHAGIQNETGATPEKKVPSGHETAPTTSVKENNTLSDHSQQLTGPVFTMAEDASMRFLLSDLIQETVPGEYGRMDESPTFLSFGTAQHGRIVREANGDIRFQADPDFSGIASFRYTLLDDSGNRLEKVARIHVENVNDAPILLDDEFTLDEGEHFSLENLLTNDRDPEGDLLKIDHLRNIDHGHIVQDNGHFFFQPEAGFHGDIIFSYWVRDHASSYPVMGESVLHYLDRNLGPTTGEDHFLIMEEDQLNTTVDKLLANDQEFDGENIVFDSLGPARHGSVVMGQNGEIVFTPTPGYSGTEAGFGYRVKDESGHLATGFARVEVLDRREDPVVSSSTRPAIMEDELLAFTPDEVAKFVTDPDGDPLHLELISNINGGSIITRNGWYTFQPDPEFSGRASFDYQAGDNRGGHVSGHLEFDILPVNDPIDTGQDHLATLEDTGIITTITHLLANDTDVDGNRIEFTGLGEAEHGTVRQEGEDIIFTPDPDYSGNEAFFTYTVKDDQGLESTGKVHIDVGGINDAPHITATRLSLIEDQPVILDSTLLATCFEDIDGDNLTVTDARALSGGIITRQDNQFVFTPDPDFHGEGSLHVTVTDGHESLAVNLSLDIQAVDDPAQCTTDILRTREEQPVTTSVTDIMVNDNDIDGDLSFAGLGNGIHGTVRQEGEDIIFTPDPDYFGDEAGFTYLVRDPDGNSSTGRVTVLVENVDDPAEITADLLHIPEDQPITFTVDEMAKFIHDPDPDPLRLATVSNVTGGRMEQSNGLYTFIPDHNFYGEASFDYAAENSRNESLSGHMNIAISPVNDLPETTLYTISGVEDHEVTIDMATLMAGATDVEDGSRLHFGGIDSSLHGDVHVDEHNTIHFLPDRDFFGTGSFRYSVVDSEGGRSHGYVTVRISGENDEPVAVDDRGIFAWSNNGYENIYDATTFLANDIDVDHDTLSITGVTGAEYGTVFLDNGKIHYIAPVDGWVGIDSFTYTVDDGHGTTSEARAEIGVRVNASPTSSPNSCLPEKIPFL
ncbi:hypothetical protein DGMP_30860 [Desulfomarina profundi]|uniref:Cadherin-like domain-containing protein n=1 Tax=Desulfomarina profundi TaxID=2772557 RepID=A0A8D5FNH8_9BACT|nr:tandem-95 repeat protein [Desulfomarina profundi]BCL62393.1 hypothetical protein DGMP_30860 [Desulfomarina profundi]